MTEQQSLIYRSGDIFLPESIVSILNKDIIGSKKETVFYLNVWHGMHFLSGVLYGLYFLKATTFQTLFDYIVIHTIWELWQVLIGMTKLNNQGFSDILNDTLMGILGLIFVLLFNGWNR